MAELNLYTKIRPALKKAKRNLYDADRTFGDDPDGFLDFLRYDIGVSSLQDMWLDESVTKMDCKRIPLGFVVETGIEYLNECTETGSIPMLPFEQVIMEFQDSDGYTHCFYMTDGDDVDGRKPLELVHINYISDIDVVKTSSGWYYVGEDDGRMFIEAGNEDLDEFNDISQVMPMCFGILSLMKEKLINSYEVITSQKSKKKKKNGPIGSDYRVLTLNLAQARRMSSGSRLKKHESPRMHWRRGHWRTIHRYTEDERNVWINKMLVGDPDKGFVNKDYALVWRPEII